jgi:hypothetical protein
MSAPSCNAVRGHQRNGRGLEIALAVQCATIEAGAISAADLRDGWWYL